MNFLKKLFRNSTPPLPLLFFGVDYLHIRLHRKIIRRSGALWILDPEVMINRPLPHQTIENNISKIVGKTIKINWIRHSEFPDLIFSAYTEAPKIIQRQNKKLSQLEGTNLIKRLYDKKGAETAQLKQMLVETLPTIYFLRIAEELIKNNKYFLLAPAHWDFFNILGSNDDMQISKISILYLWIQQLASAILLPVRLAAICRIQISQIKKNVKPRSFDFATEVHWGNVENKSGRPTLDGYSDRDFRSRWNNFFLEDSNSMSPEKILYVQRIPRFDEETSVRFDSEVNRRGSSSVVVSNLKVPIETITRWAFQRVIPHGILSLIKALFKGPNEWKGLEISFKLLNNARHWEIFCSYYRPNVMLSLDDQDLSHVARSMVFRKNKLKNLGLHHSSVAGATLVPTMAFIDFHCHFRYGPMMGELFEDVWRNQPYKNIGPIRADLIFTAQNNQVQRNAFNKKYARKQNILVAPPGNHVGNLEDRLESFFYTLTNIGKSRSDIRFIVRPRPTFNPPKNIYTMINQGIKNDYFAVEIDQFDTYELIAYCSFLICNFTSMVQEAIQANKPVLTFSFNAIKQDFYYYQVCPEMVTTTGHELQKRILEILKCGYVTKNTDILRMGVSHELYGKAIKTLRENLINLSHNASK